MPPTDKLIADAADFAVAFDENFLALARILRRLHEQDADASSLHLARQELASARPIT